MAPSDGGLPVFSFVIPVRNEAPRIHGLLRHLQRQFPRAERIVVDGGSTDDTAQQARAVAHRVLRSESGRARQMNHGAAVAGGQYLLFLHADTRPEFNQFELAAALADRPQWGFCRVRLDGPAAALRLVESAMNLRSRLTAVATGDQMLLVRNDTFVQLGGFAGIPLMEDVEICKRLRRLSRPRVIQQRVCTSSRRWEQQGVWRTVALMWRLRLAYALGANPQALHDAYYG